MTRRTLHCLTAMTILCALASLACFYLGDPDIGFLLAGLTFPVYMVRLVNRRVVDQSRGRA